MASHSDRVIVLVDMDCFYCQVEENLNPNLKGKPVAVVQYNAWKGGGIIAVNYAARDQGVTRHMRGNEAKEKCPSIELVKVPNVRGKADLTKYREAGKRVAEVLQTFTTLLQRASVDEAYLDITETVNQKLQSNKTPLTIEHLKNTHVVGCETSDFLHNIYNHELNEDKHLKLAIGGAIVEEIRAAVYEKTGYRCSAGIAHNKILAKLACGMHKPNKQTILHDDAILELYKTLPFHKIKGLGGKFGNSLSEDLKITNMSELSKFSERDLLKKYDEKTASWLYNIGRGIDVEPVESRLISKSIGCCKKFPGKLCTNEAVTHWLSELSEEMSERLEQDLSENNRRAKQIIVSFAQKENKKDIHSSRTQSLNSYDAKKIAKDTFETLRKYTQKPDGSFCLTFLGLSATKFEDCKHVNDISTFFKAITKTDSQIKKSPKISDIEPNFEMDDYLNINDIEDDALHSETNTIKEMVHDEYLDTTIELDFTEELMSKEEFPHATNKNVECFNEPSSTINRITIENSDSNSSSFVENAFSNDISKSFFMKYAKKFENHNPNNNIEISFDGSNQETPISNCPIQEIYSANNSNNDNYNNEICTECHQNVPKSDLISHMDHHMALKLMAEERQIFQTTFQANKPKQIIKSPVKQKTKRKITKRKSNTNTNSIIAFLAVKDANNDNKYECCSECGKRIAPDELQSHLDYHLAKKMHIELNPVAFSSNKVSNSTTVKKSHK